MNVMINGEARTLPKDITLAMLIEELELVGKRLAIEVNRDIVPRSAYAETMLKEGDQVEIVNAIGGGSFSTTCIRGFVPVFR